MCLGGPNRAKTFISDKRTRRRRLDLTETATRGFSAHRRCRKNPTVIFFARQGPVITVGGGIGIWDIFLMKMMTTSRWETSGSIQGPKMNAASPCFSKK